MAKGPKQRRAPAPAAGGERYQATVRLEPALVARLDALIEALRPLSHTRPDLLIAAAEAGLPVLEAKYGTKGTDR